MSLRQPPILINPINKAKPRPPRDPYSALRHRYNYPLMYSGIYEPTLIAPIYIEKDNMEYAEALDFIRTIMRDFVEQSERRSRDIIMELIGINGFKSYLLTDTFFVIDYDFLMSKYKLYTSYGRIIYKHKNPYASHRNNAIIHDVLQLYNIYKS